MADVTTLTLDAKSRAALDQLRDSLHARSNAEVIRRAITLLKLASETTDSGGQIILRDKTHGDRQIVMG